MTPSGIEPATFRFVAHHFIHAHLGSVGLHTYRNVACKFCYWECLAVGNGRRDSRNGCQNTKHTQKESRKFVNNIFCVA